MPAIVVVLVNGPAELILSLTRAVLPRPARKFLHRKTHQFNRIAALTPPVSQASVYIEAVERQAMFERFGLFETGAQAEGMQLRVSGGGSRTTGEKLTVVPLRRRVSLISTCRNEAATIESWLDSILAQEVYPEEVVICDAGSIDGTRQKIIRWYEQLQQKPFQLKVIDAPGANIARGRNLAVQMSHGDLLLFTDAGCVLGSSWVRLMLAPFAADRNVDLVMGWYRAAAGKPDGPPAADNSRFGRFRAGVITNLIHYTVPRLEQVDPSTFLPSARSMALSRNVFNRCGGFPEYLTLAGEDSLFDYYLKSFVRRAVFVPEAEVQWFVPQTIRGYFRMLRRYARGDAEGGKLFWNHYRFLLSSFGRLALDLIVMLPALYFAFAASSSAARAASLLILFYCAFSISIRIVKLAQPFQPLAGLKGIRRQISRLSALGLMLTAQCAGFLRGLLERPRAEARRLWSASAGYMFIFGPGWCVRDGAGPQQEFVERNLSQRHFVVYISTDRHCPDNTVLHPRLEQFPAEGLDLRFWIKKHKIHLRTSPTIVVAGEMKNVEASKLLNSLRGRFPDAPMIELN